MKLFTPITIGNRLIKNRVVMAPMTNHYSKNGFVTEKMISFYEERAKGGTGLITAEDAIIDYPIGNNTVNPLAIDDDKYIPMLSRLCAAIKRHDAVPMIQLSHAGRRAGRISHQSGCLETTGGRIPVAPSAMAHPSPGHVVPRPLRIEEIELIIEKFALGAQRAVKAGFEIIGLHCAHMYLCGQFLSPWANKRTDRYGGILENRLRFALEIIERIKTATGGDIPIICRMNGQEPEGGNTSAEIIEIAKRFEKAGVSALHISTGFGTVLWEKGFIPAEAITGMQEGCIVHLAENIKKAVSIPVIAVNKIRHVDFAENILQEGKADMIALARPLLADPDWTVKARENRIRDIRPCISCCQGCVGGILKGKPITCLANPRAGREEELNIKKIEPGSDKNILIIGGGPSGIVTAITAAKRGHRVTIWEKGDRLGGEMCLAAKPSRKKEIMELLEYYKYQIERLNINVKYNIHADIDSVISFNPDSVVLAMGGKPVVPAIQGAFNKNILLAVDVLKYDIEVGDSVIIIGGGLVGLETAEYLAEAGKKVTIVEMLEDVAPDMPIITKIPLLFDLEETGVNLYTNAFAKLIMQDGILIEQAGMEKKLFAETIIFATGEQPDNTFEKELRKNIHNVYCIGSCNSSGDLLSAIHDGFTVGLKI